MNKNKEQYVYVMSNSSFPEDMLKIGWTRQHPNIRANNLHTSGIPTPFIVEYVIITPNGSKLEKQIHNHINTYRVNSNREFFKISKEELTKILENDLMLELRQVTEISAAFDRKKSNNDKVKEIELLYEELKKETEDFFGKFKKENTELVIKNMNNKKYVSFRDTEYNQSSLHIHGLENDDEKHLKKIFYFINRDIIEYKELLDKLIYNYKEIKNSIGGNQMRSDNVLFKKLILKTQENLHNIRSEYVVESF
uniref:Bacteriophage T5 Orf172 DNA-binding domain-containing protein n=1 Tax=viral metagenome TaxID=1070528 RepID=A0A6C0AV47_9ZZZZ|tara:strand:- start:20694 stop:21449 length:756 start_codon:yes stop_codon:yes gene_type:complete